MEWQNLTELSQLGTIKNKSFERPQVIFKHSTTCSISKMAFSRFDKAEAPEGVDFYYLDLLQYRPISNAIAEQFEVFHESIVDWPIATCGGVGNQIPVTCFRDSDCDAACGYVGSGCCF